MMRVLECTGHGGNRAPLGATSAMPADRAQHDEAASCTPKAKFVVENVGGKKICFLKTGCKKGEKQSPTLCSDRQHDSGRVSHAKANY